MIPGLLLSRQTLKKLGAATGAGRTIVRITWPFERTLEGEEVDEAFNDDDDDGGGDYNAEEYFDAGKAVRRCLPQLQSSILKKPRSLIPRSQTITIHVHRIDR